MKVWRVTAPGTLAMEECDSNSIKEGEVKVKVTKLALTGADISVFSGDSHSKYPIVPGRIAVGLVSESNEHSQFRKSERVLLSPYIMNEKGGFTVMGMDRDGYMADYVILPEDAVFPIPDSIDDEDSIFVEYIAMAIKTMDSIDIARQKYVTIIGANSLGLILAQLAIYYQAIPIVIDKSERKLDIARDFGVYYCINSSKEDVPYRIKQITCGNMSACTIFECHRSAQDPQFAFSLTEKEGKVGIVGFENYAEKMSVDAATIMGRRLSVSGINNGAGEITTAINLLANDVIKVKGIVTKRLGFDAVPVAFYEQGNDDECSKILIEC